MKDKPTAELIAAAREEADDPTTHPYHEELFRALADRLDFFALSLEVLDKLVEERNRLQTRLAEAEGAARLLKAPWKL